MTYSPQRWASQQLIPSGPCRNPCLLREHEVRAWWATMTSPTVGQAGHKDWCHIFFLSFVSHNSSDQGLRTFLLHAELFSELFVEASQDAPAITVHSSPITISDALQHLRSSCRNHDVSLTMLVQVISRTSRLIVKKQRPVIISVSMFYRPLHIIPTRHLSSFGQIWLSNRVIITQILFHNVKVSDGLWLKQNSRIVRSCPKSPEKSFERQHESITSRRSALDCLPCCC
jgi:hypothetical protein